MPNRNHDQPDDLRDLIEAAQAEGNETLSEDFSASGNVSKLPAINHWAAISFSWLVCLFLVFESHQHPIIPEEEFRIQDAQTQLSIAIYHVAHRVEVYRDITGQLPDFLDASWSILGQQRGASDMVQYTLEDGSYSIVGRLGELEIVFRQGDDPESLIHYNKLNISRAASR